MTAMTTTPMIIKARNKAKNRMGREIPSTNAVSEKEKIMVTAEIVKTV